MSREVPYDASAAALFRPGRARDFFALGDYSSDAALCAEMSRLAYLGRGGNIDTTAVRGYLSLAGYQLLDYADTLGQQAFVAANNDTLVLAFRGTQADDWRDLWADIRFWPRDWRIDGRAAGRVHRGFAHALDTVWPRLRPHLVGGERRVLYTGHSLGAAMATLAAGRIAPTALYTFGSPRVGDAGFAAAMASINHARFVDCRDVVTRLPPALGFTHTGNHHYIAHDGRVHLKPDAAFQRADRKAALAAFRNLRKQQARAVPLRDLCDHAPINYLYATLGMHI